jgi:ribonuclease-3
MILEKNISYFESVIKFNFKDKKNLIRSLTHPSIEKINKNKDKNKNKNKNKNKFIINEFERLEFLGDRILGLIVASLIYKKFKDNNEGELSKKLAYLVQKDFLYKIALKIEIDKILQYSCTKNDFRMNKSILADSIESLIGGIFIDSGYRASIKFINYIWGPYLDVDESNEQDAKTKLQEISQRKRKILPKYSLLKKEGSPHSPIFTVSLEVLNLKSIEAQGKSKQEAEKNAATTALKLINEK